MNTKVPGLEGNGAGLPFKRTVLDLFDQSVGLRPGAEWDQNGLGYTDPQPEAR